MRSKIKIVGVFLFFVVFTFINFMSIDKKSSKDLNLNALIKVALADGESGGGLTCNCVNCPGDESGCWSYDYSISGCGGSNSGYSGSWQCEGAGRIEKHVIDCNGPC
ncbi:MAG: hypothetical protein AB2L24_32020 [Mangrovibacterium sp.]